ncbi:MAG TPA: hypothetical protein VFN71_04225 [Methylomirabilota bacterium]|nr:hypothetical protein [Methylomirabilota bacterium]
MAREVTVASLGGLRMETQIGSHRVMVDEPVDKGGTDTGPTPTELVLAALGA